VKFRSRAAEPLIPGVRVIQFSGWTNTDTTWRASPNPGCHSPSATLTTRRSLFEYGVISIVSTRVMPSFTDGLAVECPAASAPGSPEPRQTSLDVMRRGSWERVECTYDVRPDELVFHSGERPL